MKPSEGRISIQEKQPHLEARRYEVMRQVKLGQHLAESLYLLLIRHTSVEYLGDKETPIEEVAKLARALGPYAEKLTTVARELSRLADFHAAAEPAERIAARVFAKYPEAFGGKATGDEGAPDRA